MSDARQQEEVKEVLEPLIEALICDICRKSCFVRWDIEDSSLGNNHCAYLSAQWGYGSPKDLEVHKCRMCEPCYNKVAEFITQVLGGNICVEPYVPSLARV